MFFVQIALVVWLGIPLGWSKARVDESGCEPVALGLGTFGHMILSWRDDVESLYFLSDLFFVSFFVAFCFVFSCSVLVSVEVERKKVLRRCLFAVFDACRQRTCMGL